MQCYLCLPLTESFSYEGNEEFVKALRAIQDRLDWSRQLLFPSRMRNNVAEELEIDLPGYLECIMTWIAKVLIRCFSQTIYSISFSDFSASFHQASKYRGNTTKDGVLDISQQERGASSLRRTCLVFLCLSTHSGGQGITYSG